MRSVRERSLRSTGQVGEWVRAVLMQFEQKTWEQGVWTVGRKEGEGGEGKRELDPFGASNVSLRTLRMVETRSWLTWVGEGVVT